MLNWLESKGPWTPEITQGAQSAGSVGGPQGKQGLVACTQLRPRGTGGAMLWILCLGFCGLLPRTQADPGALLRLGMDVMNHGELVGWVGGPGVGGGQ